MYLPVFRTGIAGLTALILLAAAMAVFFSSGTDTALAATFTPTLDAKFCNGLNGLFPSNGFGDADLNGNPACTDPSPIALNTAYDLTTQFDVPFGSSNFGSSVFTSTDSGFQVSGDAAITDGAKVGGLHSETTLGLGNGACTTLVHPDFVLYDGTTTAGATNPLPEGTPNRNQSLVTSYTEGTANGVINAADDSYVDGYHIIAGKVDIDRNGTISAADDGALRTKAVIDGSVDINGDTVVDGADDGVLLGAGSPSALSTDVTVLDGMVDGIGAEIANADSPGVIKHIGIYDTLFDPDADFPGGPGDGTGLATVPPLARYTGITRVPAITGDWALLTFFQFSAGALKAFNAQANNRPHSFGREFRDLGATPADSLVSLSILNDPTATKVSKSPVEDFCSPLAVTTMLKGTASTGQVRLKTPIAGSTHVITAWSYGQRDADNDGIENAYDPCPFTPNTADELPDHDGDGIPDACDAGPAGFPAGGSCALTDVDCDGFANHQDNCPQTPNGAALQRDQEVQEKYSDSAPDGGPKTDSIGDACDGVVSTGCTNAIDDDGDGVVNDGCGGGNPAAFGPGEPGGGACSAPCGESPTKGDNPLGLGNPNKASVGGGGYSEKMIFVPKCLGVGSVDADGDGYCAAQDPDDSVATGGPVKGFGINHGPDTEGNSTTNLSLKYAGAKADHYGAADENYFGTNVYEACPADLIPNNEAVDSWPPDFNDDGKVNAADMTLINAQPAAVTTTAQARFDLVPNKVIDAADKAMVTADTGSLLCTDKDADFFSDADEATIGTDPAVACGVNKWPADFDNNQTIDISDVLVLKPVFGASVPPATARQDIHPDLTIDISDVLALKPIFGLSCT